MNTRPAGQTGKGKPAVSAAGFRTPLGSEYHDHTIPVEGAEASIGNAVAMADIAFYIEILNMDEEASL